MGECKVHDDDTLALEQLEMPVLAGIEAIVAVQRQPRKVVEPAETGQPETSKEFAARMRGNFVLKGPSEWEGGMKLTIKLPAQTKNPSPDAMPSASESNNQQNENPEKAKTNMSLISIISESTEGIDLLKELKGKYSLDPEFKHIFEKPHEFQNFKVTDGLVYININGKKLLCIPKILHDARNIREIVILEAHSLLAHLGAYKTLDYL